MIYVFDADVGEKPAGKGELYVVKKTPPDVTKVLSLVSDTFGSITITHRYRFQGPLSPIPLR